MVETLVIDDAGVDQVDLLRATPEYKAAWEVELWKRREEAAFARRLEEEMKAAVEARLESLRRREAEMEEQHRDKMRALSKLEEKRLREHSEMREKKSLLDECEKALRKRKEELEREYGLRRQECDNKVRRTKEESAHRIGIEHLKQNQLTATIEELRHRLKTIEGQHQTLWDDVSQSKQAELHRHPADAIREAVQGAEGRHKAVADAMRREHYAKEEALLKKVSALTSANAQLRERVMRNDSQLSAARGRAAQFEHDAALLSAETMILSKKMQVRDSDAASSPRKPDAKQLESPEEAAYAEALEVLSGFPLVASLTPAAVEAFTPQQQATLLEAARLAKEKRSLLGTGCYTEAEPVIVSISSELRKLLQSLL
eukprot:TRINITY_DN17515_c0_g4_i1.p1 TRINITY_DN17515_c0_g4~~TRINITY_DN17515_c0_g4_i1.p1  ORF type:complete len:390 (+),score=165.48 TRINITY_DN17515_c0_g4_i1:53-1171(+)